MTEHAQHQWWTARWPWSRMCLTIGLEHFVPRLPRACFEDFQLPLHQRLIRAAVGHFQAALPRRAR
ncbi:MAG TPA: hypothetical protein VKV28_11645 [Candidatus Binataceae bacterium]|nr:hypothetical protein [Candidatus Binataceae bacterium]